MRAMANLKAEVHGVERPAWEADDVALAAAIDQVAVVMFVPKDGVKIETDPKARGLLRASTRPTLTLLLLILLRVSGGLLRTSTRPTLTLLLLLRFVRVSI